MTFRDIIMVPGVVAGISGFMMGMMLNIYSHSKGNSAEGWLTYVSGWLLTIMMFFLAATGVAINVMGMPFGIHMIAFGLSWVFGSFIGNMMGDAIYEGLNNNNNACGA